jgi:hypothetical protein
MMEKPILETTISRIDFIDNNNTPDEKYRFIIEDKLISIKSNTSKNH